MLLSIPTHVPRHFRSTSAAGSWVQICPTHQKQNTRQFKLLSTRLAPRLWGAATGANLGVRGRRDVGFGAFAPGCVGRAEARLEPGDRWVQEAGGHQRSL